MCDWLLESLPDFFQALEINRPTLSKHRNTKPNKLISLHLSSSVHSTSFYIYFPTIQEFESHFDLWWLWSCGSNTSIKMATFVQGLGASKALVASSSISKSNPIDSNKLLLPSRTSSLSYHLHLSSFNYTAS